LWLCKVIVKSVKQFVLLDHINYILRVYVSAIKLYQWWSTIPLISIERTMTSDLNSLNIKQTTTNDVRNQGPGLWRDTHVNHIERGNIDTSSSMVNNSTNINKANNHLSSQPIEHKKRLMTNDIRNPSPGLGQTQSCFVIWNPQFCSAIGF
jgi:hypothetical protein